MKHKNISNKGHEFRIKRTRNLRGEGFSILLMLDEFSFDQSVNVQEMVELLVKLIAQSIFTDKNGGFHRLSLRAQFAFLGLWERG